MEENPFDIISAAINEGGNSSFPEELLKEACAEYWRVHDLANRWCDVAVDAETNAKALEDLILSVHTDIARLNRQVSTFGLAATVLEKIEAHFRPTDPEATIHKDPGIYRAGISAKHLDASKVTGEPISFVRKTRPTDF